jgi:hypothetical protein
MAELRFSGSHCSIFRMSRRKPSLSSMSRDATLRSSDTDSAMGIPAQKSPFKLLERYLLSQHATNRNQRRICSVSSLEREDQMAEVRAELSSQQDVLGPSMSWLPDHNL